MADVNEAAEKLPPSSNFSNSVALETNYQSQCIVPSAYPNLLLYLKKPQITGKRSRREKVMSVNSYRNTGLKKHRCQDKNYNPDTSHSTGKNHEPRNSLKVLPGSMRLESIVQKEENQVSEKDVSHVVLLNTNDCPKVHGFFSQDENKCSSFDIQSLLPKDGKPVSLIRYTSFLLLLNRKPDTLFSINIRYICSLVATHLSSLLVEY